MPEHGGSNGGLPAEPGGLAALLLDHPFGGSEVILSSVTEERTVDQLRARVTAAAEDIVRTGVAPGQAVAVQLDSSVDMVVAMFGAWLAGAVYVPVNPRMPAPEVAYVLESVKPAAVWEGTGLRALTGGNTYDGDVAFVMWTSGTTGRPKPILQTHSGYLEILGRVLGSLRSGNSDSDPAHRPTPNLIPVSVALNAGLYNVLFGLMAGASVVLMDRFVPSDFATLVDRHQIRSTVLPPAAMTALTDAPEVISLAPLRYVRSITAPLSPLAARRFMDRFGVIVLNGYGQAEIGEVIGWTAADAKAHPEKLGAAGRPHPGVEIKVTGTSGEVLSAGAAGELHVRPPRMAAGYAGGESLSDRVDADGFVRTGDFATVDEDGFVWIEGRASDLINRGGNKVFPDQVEEVLLLAAGVREVSVVGVPDERLGQVPVAFFVGEATDEELESLCREHLVPYKIPTSYHRVAALPRSEVGKVQRNELIRSLATGATGGGDR